MNPAPRDLTFFLCIGGFFAGLIIVVVTVALMRNWVQENDHAFDPDTFQAVPVIGGLLLLLWSFGRYVQLRRWRSLPLALACLGGAAMTGIASYVLEVR